MVYNMDGWGVCTKEETRKLDQNGIWANEWGERWRAGGREGVKEKGRETTTFTLSGTRSILSLGPNLMRIQCKKRPYVSYFLLKKMI